MSLLDRRIAFKKGDALLLERLLAMWHRCPECGHLDASELVSRSNPRLTAKVSASITPHLMVKLDDYAARHHWSRSTAALVLIERELSAGDMR